MDDFLRTAAEKLRLPDHSVRDAAIELLLILRNRLTPLEFARVLGAVPGAAELLASRPPAPPTENAGGQLQRAASILGTRASGPLDATGFARRSGLSPEQIGPFVALFRANLAEQPGSELSAAILKCAPELDALSR